MAKKVAKITTVDGFNIIFHDDWTWTAPDEIGNPLIDVDLDALRDLGRVGSGVVNLYDTAIAGAGLFPGAEVVEWYGDFINERENALQRYWHIDGFPPGGPIP